ncbi:hypothetical protein D3C71_25380 [compost metagenome]
MTAVVDIRPVGAMAGIRLVSPQPVTVEQVLRHVLSPLYANRQIQGPVEFQLYDPESEDGRLGAAFLSECANEAEGQFEDQPQALPPATAQAQVARDPPAPATGLSLVHSDQDAATPRAAATVLQLVPRH